jgi:hypothetical protein
MLKTLGEMLEAVTSRRSVIGKGGARIVALMAGIFGLTHVAKASCVQDQCCCLCQSSSGDSCVNDCTTTPGASHWCWTCYNESGVWACFECFWNVGGCGGSQTNCDSGNLMCSASIAGGGCPGGDCT